MLVMTRAIDLLNRQHSMAWRLLYNSRGPKSGFVVKPKSIVPEGYWNHFPVIAYCVIHLIDPKKFDNSPNVSKVELFSFGFLPNWIQNYSDPS